MSLDLKFIEPVDDVLVGATWPSPDFVEDDYALIQQIVKALLTNPGDDAFDSGFGGGIKRALLGIPGQDTTRATQVASAAVQKVKNDLSSPRLLDLRLREIVYDVEDTAWHLSIDLTTPDSVVPIALGV